VSEYEPESENELPSSAEMPANGHETADVLEPEPDPTSDITEAAEALQEALTAAHGMSERELEKRMQAVERRAKSYVDFVAAFAAETEQPLVRCAVCLDQVPGYHWHPDVIAPNEVQVAACRVLAGLTIEPSFPQDPQSWACETCDGWGQVKTGSKREARRVVECADCNGQGFKTRRPPQEVRLPAATVNGEQPVPVLTEEEQSDDDAWGTPRSHPDWGKAPQYRTPGWQAALEAYRRGEPAPIP
jgi:hypothetical protein